MKLGRFVTVTDVYQYIDTFLGGAPTLVLGAEGLSIPHGEITKVTFGSYEYDNCGLWSPAAPQEINIPEAWRGIYSVDIQVDWVESALGWRWVGLGVLERLDYPSDEGKTVSTNLGGYVYGPAWQWEVNLYQNSGGSLEVSVGLFLRWVQPLPA